MIVKCFGIIVLTLKVILVQVSNCFRLSFIINSFPTPSPKNSVFHVSKF